MTADVTAPSAGLSDLDTLWLQVAGTICNLQCAHCFISCSPSNHTFEMMTPAQVRRYLDEAVSLGVREYYLTGGEPFMNPGIMDIIEAALACGPVSVLTNGLLLRPETCSNLKLLADGSEHSLDLRVSIDGIDAAGNDPIRGAGTFDRIVAGLRNLAAAGLDPVVTVTEACAGAGTTEGRARFLEFLRGIGLPRPRLKVMPLLRIGAEQDRSRAYETWETLRGRDLTPEQTSALQCATCRMATARGVWVCPILLDVPGARMGSDLADTLRPFELKHSACYTCWETGFTCRT